MVVVEIVAIRSHAILLVVVPAGNPLVGTDLLDMLCFWFVGSEGVFGIAWRQRDQFGVRGRPVRNTPTIYHNIPELSACGSAMLNYYWWDTLPQTIQFERENSRKEDPPERISNQRQGRAVGTDQR